MIISSSLCASPWGKSSITITCVAKSRSEVLLGVTIITNVDAIATSIPTPDTKNKTYSKKKNNKIIGYYIHADGFTDFLTLKELAKNFDYLEQEQKEEILNSFDD